MGDVDFHALVPDESRINGQLMFRLAENLSAIVVHESVRKAIEAAGIPGFVFMAPANGRADVPVTCYVEVDTEDINRALGGSSHSSLERDLSAGRIVHDLHGGEFGESAASAGRPRPSHAGSASSFRENTAGPRRPSFRRALNTSRCGPLSTAHAIVARIRLISANASFFSDGVISEAWIPLRTIVTISSR
jgi:hypothetical protein